METKWEGYIVAYVTDTNRLEPLTNEPRDHGESQIFWTNHLDAVAHAERYLLQHGGVVELCEATLTIKRKGDEK